MRKGPRIFTNRCVPRPHEVFLNPLPWLDHKHTKLQWGAQTLYSNLGPNLCKYWNIHVSAGTHLETQHVSHGLQKCIKWQLVNGAHKKSLDFSMSHCFRHFLPDRKILLNKKKSLVWQKHTFINAETHTHTHAHTRAAYSINLSAATVATDWKGHWLVYFSFWGRIIQTTYFSLSSSPSLFSSSPPPHPHHLLLPPITWRWFQFGNWLPQQWQPFFQSPPWHEYL